MNQFSISEKIITVYPGHSANLPVVYLNTFGDSGEAVYRQLETKRGLDFHLVTITGLQWNHDMSPWKIPPIAKGDTPCTGGADAYLKLLTGEIVPKAERFISGEPLWRGIAGYSLAGLFAVYSLYEADLFSKAASISGSLWFPGFQEYIADHPWREKPSCVYFSLGDRECRTRNPFLKVVQERTEKIHNFYAEKGIHTVFQINPGNHFQDEAKRTAKGIRWISPQ